MTTSATRRTPSGWSPPTWATCAWRASQSAGGIESLEFTQSVGGIPIVDSSLRAHLDGHGRLLAISGGLVPEPALDTPEPEVSKEAAVAAAARGVTTSGASFQARLVAYTAGGELRLAWRVMVRASSTARFDTLVDASSGEVVRRTNLVKFGTGLLFDNYPGAPVGGTAASKDLTPYVYPGANRLMGPNAHAFVDPEDVVPGSDLNDPVTDPLAGDETPPTSPDNFVYPFGEFATADYDCRTTFRCSWDPKTAGSWSSDGDQAATQLFWFVNRYHDHLKAAPGIHFGPESGNFESTGSPATDDLVIAQAQDGADTNGGFPDLDHSNNANMLVLPDGQPGFMQMYLWDPIADLDPVTPPNYRAVHGGDDPSLVFHEYTHGLTNRLVTDPQGYGALNGAQAGAIDEGTADWYALDYLVGDGSTAYLPDDSDTPDVRMASYEIDGPTGLRTQPIDCLTGSSAADCPSAGGGAGAGGYTYGDFATIRGGAEPHDDGEIWGQALWQLRERLIAVHGPSDGITRAERLVTNGLRLVPPNPSFLDMRNAILLADIQANGGDRGLIWSVFAGRGMGYAASTVDTDDVHPLQDFTTPPGGSTPVGSLAGVVRDQDTGAPLAGALVAFAGHDSGLDEDLATHTAANGSYRIDGVPARTWSHVTIAPAAGYDRAVANSVAIVAGTTSTRDFALRRNWALESGGAAVQSFTGPDFASFGCGPRSAIDGSSRSVWSTRSPTYPSLPGAKEIVIQLPQAITLGEVRIDPSTGCGDPAAAAVAGFEVQVSANASTYSTVSQGTFTAASAGRANPVALGSRPAGVRYVKVRALSTQGASSFMDLAEIQVFALPPVVTVPPPPPPPTPAAAKLKFLTKSAKLSRRRGFVWKLAGPKGARAKALFTVRVRRGGRLRKITLARASFRLSKSKGRARVVVRVSRRTLKRIKARKLRVTVTVRAAGQRKTGTFRLTRPKPRRRN